jgi:hypothetical protein
MKVVTSLEIKASADAIWDVLTDCDSWEWNRWFRFAQGDKPVTGGKGTLRLSSKGDDKWDLELNCVFREVDKTKYMFRFVAWMGGGLALHGNHHFRLVKLSETTTRVEHEETFTGFVGRFVLKNKTVTEEYEVRRSFLFK